VKHLTQDRCRVVKLTTEPPADSAKVPSVRCAPPIQGAITFALDSGKCRVYFLKRDEPHVHQFDDRNG
jgi:hypothetical protein